MYGLVGGGLLLITILCKYCQKADWHGSLKRELSHICAWSVIKIQVWLLLCRTGSKAACARGRSGRRRGCCCSTCGTTAGVRTLGASMPPMASFMWWTCRCASVLIRHPALMRCMMRLMML